MKPEQGPEAATIGPEQTSTAGPIEQSLCTITSLTWSDATRVRNDEVDYGGASAPGLESGMQRQLPAAALAGHTGDSRKAKEGCLLWAPSLLIPPETSRTLIPQLASVKGKIRNWMRSQIFLEVKCVSSKIFTNIW